VDAALGPHPGEGQITLACALVSEERAARKGGAQAARVGLGAGLALPEGRMAGFGLAGALVDGLEPGTVVTATRIVDEAGTTLWEGEPLPVPGARPAVICAASEVVDGPLERAGLAARSGADAVDLESGRLAASRRLAGVVRAISDTPGRPVGRLARASRGDGRVRWGVVLHSFATEPLTSLRAARDARRALAALELAAGAFRVRPS
jgi:hypothetical protein